MDDKRDVGIVHSEEATVHGQATEDPRPWYQQPELRKLYLMMPFLFLGSTTLGYDGSLLNGLQTMPAWKECTLIYALRLTPKIPYILQSNHKSYDPPQ